MRLRRSGLPCWVSTVGLEPVTGDKAKKFYRNVAYRDAFLM